MHPICNDIRRIGTAAIELCMLAEGAVDIYFEIRLCPWDFAAASVILSEAGGCMISMEGPVDYDHACTVIAANREDNLETLAKVVREEFGGKTPYDFRS
jgi:myo-inositol-1(or 4)-monophosphatase